MHCGPGWITAIAEAIGFDALDSKSFFWHFDQAPVNIFSFWKKETNRMVFLGVVFVKNYP